MNDGRNKTGIVVLVLILIIVVLIGVIGYAFWVRPAVSGYVIDKQLEAKDIVLNNILLQVQQQGYVQIADQDGNSVVLVPVQPAEQPAQ